MADPVAAAAQGAEIGQPKAALHYRQGGDHCGVCMHYTATGEGNGTCPEVIPHDVDAADVCDHFGRAARASDQASAGAAPPMAENLARRGMISDKAMAGLRGRDY